MVIAVSHIGKYDFEIVNEVIAQHFHILASDFMNMYGNINGLFMQVNGVIYIDVEDRQDRENSRQMMLQVLESGDNMMIFPEGTWNISENEIIKDIHFGAVDIAMEKETVIVPIAVEQYHSRFVINIGDIFDPNEIKNVITDIPYSALSSENAVEKNIKYQIKQTATMELRDRLATLKYQIWEREGIERRENISLDYWQHFIEERCREWPGYSMREQVINSYIPAWRREYNDMLSSIQQMRVSNANEFLFRK
jgi:1-acyl-sn-glycerol-3-phosphate acyltransferase